MTTPTSTSTHTSTPKFKPTTTTPTVVLKRSKPLNERASACVCQSMKTELYSEQRNEDNIYISFCKIKTWIINTRYICPK